ncbi:DinB/UmuC family translesion DNA polymerase [Streptomyces sp. NPDC002784]
MVSDSSAAASNAVRALVTTTGLTCTIHYADQSSTRRSRTLPEATQHTVPLARTAYAIYDSLGLQRAIEREPRRARGIRLR